MKTRLRETLLIAFCILGLGTTSALADGMPTIEQLSKYIASKLAQNPKYQTGDLLTQGAVKHVLVGLKSNGFVVEKHDEIIKQTLSDDDFLIRQLSDDTGRAFLKKIANLNGGIDRLDRLARIPNGEASVNDLIRKVPNGDEWIEAMVTTKRGRILGDRLSNSRQISNFNDPTNRIYTVTDLAQAIHPRLKRVAAQPTQH